MIIEQYDSVEKFIELVKDISEYVEEDTSDEGEEELDPKELS